MAASLKPSARRAYPMICGWSPDGSRLAYIFANKNEEMSEASVCVYDLASGETKKTTGGYHRGDFGSGGDAPPIWAPDSQHFSYQIWDRRRKAGLRHCLPSGWQRAGAPGREPGRHQGLRQSGSWSPDGKRIVFVAYPTKARNRSSGSPT